MATVIRGTDDSASTPALTGTDGDTGVFFPAANTMAMSTGGTERMRIDSSGNVGIGTSSPGAKLDVSYGGYQNSLGAIAIGADVGANTSRTNATRKYGVISGVHYTNAQSNVLGIYIDSDGTNNYIGYGGGPSGFNAATIHQWFTAANNTTIGGTERMRIDSSGNVGIGTSSPGTKLEVKDGFISTYDTTNANGAGYSIRFYTNANSGSKAEVGRLGALQEGAGNNGTIIFSTSSSGSVTERARITSGGDLLVGKTATAIGTQGSSLNADGIIHNTTTAQPCLLINRLTDDGELVRFYQASTQEGSISVSGATVSYNSFAGAHWSQLQQGRGYNPEIPRGTVLSSIGEMAEWKSAVWDEIIEHPAIPAVEAVEGKDAVLDEEGNVIEPAVEAVAAVEGKDAWTETIPRRKAYLGDLPVGATFEENGVTKTVVDDGNERLPKVKISDVVGDKAVYGVFQTWDEVQDMLVTSLGAFVVRIAAGVTVQIGDLLESNGDGCAKVQDDDVIRSKTIGKVTSITPSATYADGSYTVPAVLYCG